MVDLSKIAKGKVAVFIDAANVFYSQRTLKWFLDYQKLQDFLNSSLNLQGIYYYSGQMRGQDKQLKFINRLKEIGIHVFEKEIKFIKLKNHQMLHKGNLDVELAIDAYRMSSNYDTLFLFSGDSDFAYLIKLVKEKGKRVVVFSTRGHISGELLSLAKYIDLRKLKDELSYTKKSGATLRHS